MIYKKLYLSLCVLFSFVLLLPDAGRADDNPRFSNYPAKIYQGPGRDVRIESRDEIKYQDILVDASYGDINFAGRMIFTSWRVEAGCYRAAAIDVVTGKVSFLPSRICAVGKGKKPTEVKATSSLLVVNGKLEGKADASTSFFQFDGNRFKPINVPAQAPAAPTPSPLDADHTNDLLTMVNGSPDAGPLWKCFTDGMRGATDVISSDSPDEKRYFMYVMLRGGFLTIGDRVRSECNLALVGDLKGKEMSEGASSANQLFNAVLLVQDKSFFAQCRARTAPDWEGVRALCSRSEQSLDTRLHIH